MPKERTKLAVTQPLVERDATAAQHFRTWINNVSGFVPIVGSGSPEGSIEAVQYAVYVDETTPAAPVVYRKMLAEVGGDRSKGWVSGIGSDSIAVDELTVTGDLVMSGGTLIFTGDSTVWDDIQTSLIGRRLASTSGTVTYDYAENTVVFAPSGSITNTNDTVVFNLQLPHGTKIPSTMQLHMHYEQDTATSRTMTVRYRIQNNGSAKTATWTTTTAVTTNSAFPYTSGTLNNILPLASIDLTGASLSAVVQVQMTRTDSNTGNLHALFVDAHIEKDQIGSDEEYVK